MSISSGGGRLGNQFIRHLAASIFAEKFNLYIEYVNAEPIEEILGMPLFVGTNKYNKTNKLSSNNYLHIYFRENIDFNVEVSDYLQSVHITNLINEYLNTNLIMNKVMKNNKFNNRYKNNNDCFLHIRIGDVEQFNPGFEYYDNILSKLKFDDLYVATDSSKHKLIETLKNKYPNLKLYKENIINTILFGSTCRYIVLSYGTFSSVIGYLSYYSTVYYVPYCEKYAWDWGKNCDTNTNKKTRIAYWIQG